MSIKLEKGEELVKSDNDYGSYNYLSPEVLDKKNIHSIVTFTV